MRKARIGTARAGSLVLALAATVALAGCGAKETGPEAQDTAATAPATATPVPAAVADPAATKPLLSFAGMDADGDGVVTSAENARASQTIFQAMDLDKDGAVTLTEMDAARAAIGRGPNLSSEKLIEAADADHDGKLTLGEWVATANARFARFDTNTDETLTLAEWQAGMAAEMPEVATQPAPPAATATPARR